MLTNVDFICFFGGEICILGYYKFENANWDYETWAYEVLEVGSLHEEMINSEDQFVVRALWRNDFQF